MKLLKLFAVPALLVALAACQSSPSRPSIKITKPEDFSPIDKALHKEYFVKGFTKAELNKIARFKSPGNEKITFYDFKREKLQNGEEIYCTKAFTPKTGTSRYRDLAHMSGGMTASECNLLALKHLRPQAYKSILNNPELVTPESKRKLESW